MPRAAQMRAITVYVTNGSDNQECGQTGSHSEQNQFIDSPPRQVLIVVEEVNRRKKQHRFVVYCADGQYERIQTGAMITNRP